MAQKPQPVPIALLERYDRVIAAQPGVERKGAAIPYTSVNGNMFSYLGKTGTLALRLPEEARGEFLKKYKTKLCEQYGVVQKEYVHVPEKLLADTAALAPWFAASCEYTRGLKPKPTERG